MCTNIHKYHVIRCCIYLSINRANISGHIDTSVVSIFPVKSMVIESLVVNIFVKISS